jgi:glutamate synthase domain-containing protein 3
MREVKNKAKWGVVWRIGEVIGLVGGTIYLYDRYRQFRQDRNENVVKEIVKIIPTNEVDEFRKSNPVRTQHMTDAEIKQVLAEMNVVNETNRQLHENITKAKAKYTSVRYYKNKKEDRD